MSKFTADEEQLLRLFQCEENRHAEESFARVFTEKDYIHLAFINEDRAFTDGKNITLDPAIDRLFADKPAVEKTVEYLNLPQDYCDPWAVLNFTTRSQDIHECLHVIYSAFPPLYVYDKRYKNLACAKALGMIDNVIEDAYIESVGASVYENTEVYLKWGRMSRLVVNAPSEGTVSRVFREAGLDNNKKEVRILMGTIDYMAGELLYPMMEHLPPDDEIRPYVERVYSLFQDGSTAPSPAERASYVFRIFDILEELVPEDENEIDMSFFSRIMGGIKTHSADTYAGSDFRSEGKSCVVTRRLFTDLDGNPIKTDITQAFLKCIEDFGEIYVRLAEESEEGGQVIVLAGNDFSGASFTHRKIKITENHPKPEKGLYCAYNNLIGKYRSTINKYNSRFDKLLKVEREIIEEKQLFGNGISSANLGDVKGRYWHRKRTEYGVPNMAIMVMIDGSGSMAGQRRAAAMTASVVLHEVLAKQNVEHCIAVHRAIYGEPLVEHEVLVDFSGNKSEKYNLLKINSYDGTREGLSLFWADGYINRKSTAEKKLIIVISDGIPAHIADERNKYLPPVSVEDTRETVRKISHGGTRIIALALGGREGNCYEALKDIYPRTIECDDPDLLTGQLLKIISKEFM